MAKAQTTETAPAARAKVCKKAYIMPDGSRVRSANADAVGLEFSFANGAVHVVTPEDYPANVQRALLWYGVSESHGNAYAGVGGDADLAEQQFLAKRELCQSGVFVERSGRGEPRITVLLEAIVRAGEASGKTIDREKYGAWLADADNRKAAKADPAVSAAYATIIAERAAERAAAKNAKAESTGFGLDID